MQVRNKLGIGNKDRSKLCSITREHYPECRTVCRTTNLVFTNRCHETNNETERQNSHMSSMKFVWVLIRKNQWREAILWDNWGNLIMDCILDNPRRKGRKSLWIPGPLGASGSSGEGKCPPSSCEHPLVSTYLVPSVLLSFPTPILPGSHDNHVNNVLKAVGPQPL